MAPLEPGAHLFLDRLPQSSGGHHELVLELRYVSARDSIDHGHDCSGVSLGEERLQTRTIIWAAGVKASPAAEWFNAECDRAGRVKVQGDLSVPGHPNIFVIGDAAAASGPGGKPLPGVAAVAKQQGWYAANLLMARAEGKTLPAFRYRDLG